MSVSYVPNYIQTHYLKSPETWWHSKMKIWLSLKPRHVLVRSLSNFVSPRSALTWWQFSFGCFWHFGVAQYIRLLHRWHHSVNSLSLGWSMVYLLYWLSQSKSNEREGVKWCTNPVHLVLNRTALPIISRSPLSSVYMYKCVNDSH